MTDEQLKIVLGTITANTMLILQAMKYDLNTPVELLEEIEIAVNTTDKVLQMITKDMEDI